VKCERPEKRGVEVRRELSETEASLLCCAFKYYPEFVLSMIFTLFTPQTSYPSGRRAK